MAYGEMAFGSVLGLFVGMRHVFEVDHLAAVSTLVSQRASPTRAARLGCWWGVGHTMALSGVGAVVLFLEIDVPLKVAVAFELCVAAMLVGLGARALLVILVENRARDFGKPLMFVRSGDNRFVDSHFGRWTVAGRPFLVGLTHGLAGSGAVTAMVVLAMPSTATRVAYIILFGLGSTVGMSCLSGILGWRLAKLGAAHTGARVAKTGIGALSLIYGLVWGYLLLRTLLLP